MTDEELIEEIQSGSKAALESLIRKYYYEVYNFIYRRTHQQPLAYDLTQEVFSKVFLSISSYKGEGKFRSWVLTIALNQIRDYMRSKQVTNKSMENEWIEESFEDQKGNVAYLYEKKEESREIIKALGELSDFQSEAIILKYFHGYKYYEIAEMTKTKETTVKSRVFQGLRKLSQILRRHENEGRNQSN
ncbi:RNA polymerase sigma factor [Bacillus infantis]|uniref:RNA polymerase sigma factor n=1 Tax=Bacillus infantis TaxID=324767 RepID=UPI003CEDBA07